MIYTHRDTTSKDEDSHSTSHDESSLTNTATVISLRETARPKERPNAFASTLEQRALRGANHKLDSSGHIVGSGFLRRKRAHSIIGLPGAGKSMVQAHLAICLRTGEKFFGRPVAKSHTAFFACEAADSTLDRLWLGAKRAGLVWPVKGLIVVPGGLDLKDPKQLSGVIEFLKRAKVEVVMFDTANASGSGDEGPGDMGAYSGACNDIVQKTDVALLVSHHTPATGNPKERGHSSLRGLLDLSSFVTKTPGEGRQLSIGKARDGEEELFGAFTIEGEKQGVTNLGEPWVIPYLVETAVKPHVASDAPKEASIKQKKIYERLVLQIIRDLCSGCGSCERAHVHVEFAARSKTPERSQRSKTTIVNGCLRSLKDLGTISVDKGVVKFEG